MISQLKWAAASCGSSSLSTPRSARLSKASASAADRAAGAELVEGPAELREAAGLADHDPAQLEQARLHHPREQPAGQVAQVGLDVAAVAQVEHLLWVGSPASLTVPTTISEKSRSLSAKCL